MNAYTYDALNRVATAVTTKSDSTLVYSVSYEYDLVGNRINIDETSLGADNVETDRYLHYEYDERYQLVREWWNDDDKHAPDVGADLAYTYDLAGNRTELWRGNSLATTYTYNARNEIGRSTTDGFDTTYTYDVNGNRTSKSVGGGGAYTYYIYDTSNRLTFADVDGAEVFHATYDYRTRRVSKKEPDGAGGMDETIFRYDGGVSFDEWKDAGGNRVFVKQVEFVRGSGMGGGIGSILYSDRPVENGTVTTATDVAVAGDGTSRGRGKPEAGEDRSHPDWAQRGAPDGTPRGRPEPGEERGRPDWADGRAQPWDTEPPPPPPQPSGGREYFVYSPAVGHTVATLTENEAVKSTNLYEAFGNVVKLDAGTWVKSDGPTSGASDNNRLANTKERDASIRLDNHGFRYYDPEIGRYTTRDPIGYRGGPNVYRSVFNNPINFMDPLGLVPSTRERKPSPGPRPGPKPKPIEDESTGEAYRPPPEPTFEGTKDDVAEARRLYRGARLFGSKELNKLLDPIGPETRINVGRNQPGVFVGSAERAEIDLADISKFPTTGPGSQESLIVHEVVEQYKIQQEGIEDARAHRAGGDAEEAVTGWKRKPGQYIRHDPSEEAATVAVIYTKGRKRAAVIVDVLRTGEVIKVERRFEEDSR